MEAGASD